MANIFNEGMPRFSKAPVPAPDTPQSVDRAIDLIAAAHADVAEAEAKGLFVPLPERKPDRSKDLSRIKTIRNRMFILGYLEKDSGRGNLDQPLNDAVRSFQAEAGLEVDGWVGEQTWSALQELVSFETPCRLQRWFSGGTALPALRRAAALRLFVLGLLPEQPRSPDEDILPGLKAFARTWKLLFADAPPVEPGLNPEWLALLFDMDGITRRLAQTQRTLEAEEVALAHAFILNTAKVELWLLGYNVRPGGYDLVQKPVDAPAAGGADLSALDIWMRSATVSQYYRVKRNLLFYKALHLFWMDHGATDDDADTRSVEFLQDFQSFFHLVDEEIRIETALDEGWQPQELEDFIRARKDQLPSIWDRVKRFGARLWDGLKRVWGWFKQMLTRFKKAALTIGENLSRLVYNFALRSFGVVSHVFKSLDAAIRWVVHPVLTSTGSRDIIICRDADYDLYLAIAEDADPHEISKCCRELSAQSRRFVFACRVIGVFISMFKDALSLGWSGYFGLVLVLIRMRGWKQRFADLAEDYRQLLAPAV